METPICQIALSVSDLARSRSWYEQLDLEPTGGMGPVSGEFPAQMLELPELEVNIGWLAGRDSMSQLELIQFSRPAPRPLPKNWGPRWEGYGIIGLVVPDFEKVLHQLRAAGREHSVTGSQNSRSVWTRDPDGIPVEIMEKDPIGLRQPAAGDGALASIRTVSLTVRDLKSAKRYWTSAVGLSACRPADFAFNAFPGNLDDGVSSWEQELVKGGTLLIRLLSPRSSTLIPRASDRRLSDAGVLNIAAILDGPEPYAALRERVRKLGYTFSTEVPMTIGDDAATIYGRDDQGNSVEIGFVLPGHEGKYGWRR